MRILVTLDGSELSEKALVAVVPLAGATGAEVLLLSVLDPGDYHATTAAGEYLRPSVPAGVAIGFAFRGVPVDAPPTAVEDRTQALERARVETEEALKATAMQYLPGIATQVHVEWSGDAAEAIAAFASQHDVDLVAIGTHGRSGVSQALMGSVAAALVRHSPVPVMLVREGMRLG